MVELGLEATARMDVVYVGNGILEVVGLAGLDRPHKDIVTIVVAGNQ